MPRKERRNNNVQKEMAKAGSSARQTKIIDTFFALSSCGRGVHGGNAASNFFVRSPNAKDVDTNGNLNTGDGIANSENNMGLDVARSTCDTSVSIFRNTSRSNVNDFDPKLCCVFDAENFSETDREIVGTKREDLFKKNGLIVSNDWHIIKKSKKFFAKFVPI